MNHSVTSVTYRKITEVTVQATSLWQFANADGSQKVGMPFWVDHDNALGFNWMTKETNGRWLEKLIKEEKVWIRTCDASQPNAVKKITNRWVKVDGRIGMRMI